MLSWKALEALDIIASLVTWLLEKKIVTKNKFYFILEQDLFPDWTTKDEPESDHGMDFDNFDDFKEYQNDDNLVKKTGTANKVK